ncbi:MAG: hypothetical protein ABIQ99_15545 [Thermoflexales bacterium]
MKHAITLRAMKVATFLSSLVVTLAVVAFLLLGSLNVSDAAPSQTAQVAPVPTATAIATARPSATVTPSGSRVVPQATAVPQRAAPTVAPQPVQPQQVQPRARTRRS